MGKMKKDYILISVLAVLICLLLIVLCFKNNSSSVVTKEVTISEAVVYLRPGKDYSLSVSSTGNKKIVFESSNPSVATVDRETGKVEALSTGTVTISAIDASNNTVYDSVEVVVEGSKTTQTTKQTTKTTNKEQSVTVSFNKNVVTLDVGKTETINATVLPKTTADKTLIWTSDNESVATVSNGTITAVGGGTANITATTVTGNTATCKVTVIEKIVNVSSIKINADKKAVYTGSTLGLSITVNPSDAKDKTITWSSSDNNIATVSSDGIVTGVNPGSVTITARSNNGKESVIKISVLDSGDEISSIRINTNGTSLKIGDSLTLVATISPSYAQNKSVTWTSSDSSVVSINSSGVITANKIGTAIITATSSNGKTATSKINVVSKSVEVTSIQLNKSKVEAKVGDKVELYGIITPTNASNQKLTWTSSDNSIATVSYGTVTTKKAGTVTITATSSNGKSASSTIVISEREVTVTKISLSKTFTTLYIGQEEKITAILTPSNVTDKTVTWTSANPQIATVSSDGTIKGVSVGTVEILAKSSNGKEASMKVRVESGVTSISLNKSNISLEVGKAEQLVATILPSNAPDKSVTWLSSDESVATVSKGVVTAKKAGTVTITAKSIDGKTASCTVIVNNKYVAVTDIKLNTSRAAIRVGETVTLVATISPSDATDKTVTWYSSDNNIATVENGVVTGKKAGTVTITAKSSNGKVATCIVYVNSIVVPVTDIKINTENVTINVGGTVILTTTIIPSNATDKTVTWSSSDSNIATVSNKGEVTGKKAGAVTITAKSSNGKTATSKVTVKSNAYFKLDKTTITCEVGSSATVSTSSSSSTKIYTVYNNKIASVALKETNKYVVNCSSAGFTTIKFEGLDGASAVLSVYVIKKNTGYNIASDSKFDKYEQVASCYSNTISYRIIKIDENYYSLVWVQNANKQINTALANYNAQGVAPIEEIFGGKTGPNKCFIGINGSFTTNESPRTNVVISEGRVAKNKGNASNVIGIDGSGNLKLYNNYSKDALLKEGIRNTIRVSGKISADTSTDVALRTQIYQYDKNNFVLYSGRGTVSSGLANVKSLTGINEGYNLEGGAGRKLYYRTKTSSLIQVVGGSKKIPDALYISE